MQEAVELALPADWVLGGVAALAGVSAYLGHHFLKGKGKMITANEEQIVQELERAGLTLGVDKDGDVTLEHVLAAIRKLGDSLRAEQAETRRLGRYLRSVECHKASVVAKYDKTLKELSDTRGAFTELEQKLAAAYSREQVFQGRARKKKGAK